MKEQNKKRAHAKTVKKISGKLYICATPIGNLEDISERAINVLRKVDLIACEDTRNSIKLLNYYDIKTPMESYHQHNRFAKADRLVEKMLQGMEIALISDAGTPCIQDPGEVLVQKCIRAGIDVTSVPGSCAVITALTLSGFSTGRFVFEGFLPPRREKNARMEALERLKYETGVIVLFEAPHHLRETLSDLIDVLGPQRKLVLCKEMTKIYETVVRTTLLGALSHDPRGEYVLVISGLSKEEIASKKRETFSGLSVAGHVQYYMSMGLGEKEAMKKAALDRGVSRREIYNFLKKIK